MGKRKSSAKKPAKKIKQTLDTQFTCLFCNHEKSVICTLDKKNLLGELHCKICGQSFQTAIHSLSQPVDIYSDWIDACEDLAEEGDQEGGQEQQQNDDDIYSDDEYESKGKITKLESEDDY
ncbi:Transcription elongation factor 1 [Spathaspora sp. JA1]|nr:Transcription elongation factor 1 [Spathaspora sp. JA1]